MFPSYKKKSFAQQRTGTENGPKTFL